MNQQNIPIAFEIQIKDISSPQKEPLIKAKLEKSSDAAAPTLEEIQQKLKNAEKLRLEELNKKKEFPILNDIKITQGPARKEKIDKE